MKKPINNNSGKHQATLFMCLVVAFTIASVSLFVGQVFAAENPTHPQLQEIANEEAQDTQGSSPSTAGVPDATGTGQDRHHSGDPKYCYITLAFGEDVPKIHPANTIKVNTEICNEIGMLIVTYYYERMTDLE